MTVTEEELAAVLRHCRSLLAAAEELAMLLERRVGLVEEALVRWRGPTAVAFAAQAGSDDAVARAAVGLLRAEADAWARAWADAVNDHNARRWVEQAGGVDGGVMSRRPLAGFERVIPPRAEQGYAPTGVLSVP